jgi:hypothetical protein
MMKSACSTHCMRFTQISLSSLTPEEFALLRQYYLVGEEVPESIFSYREQISSEDPEIAAKASRAFKTVCMLFRIEGG